MNIVVLGQQQLAYIDRYGSYESICFVCGSHATLYTAELSIWPAILMCCIDLPIYFVSVLLEFLIHQL